jgi:flagellar hook-associated protein 2
MAGIQSSTGLITGIPIEDTVNKLMAIASAPKDNLAARNKDLSNEKLAVAQLSSLLLAFQFEANQLGDDSQFDARQVSSSNTAALSATLAQDGTPAVGNYLFTPVQLASTQQLLSQTFGPDAAVGAGTITFGSGAPVDKGISLDELNAGQGVARGKIRITDRSGASAVIDLSYARTVDDVLAAINANTDINVLATTAGDTFKLTDNSGGSGNLKVQEVAGGTTAAGLGLAAIDTNSSTATGSDVFTLSSVTKLASLNDGAGVELRSGNDLSFTFKDGSTLDVDLGSAKTIGEVLATLNAAAPTKFSATIGPDGNRLKLTDLTTGVSSFSVTNADSGTTADDLGLSTAAIDDTITGQRLVSGLRDTLVSSLKGGEGLGTLGHISITNRNNVTSDVNLSGAETLGQIISAINTQATGVTASINPSHTGLVLTDTTGATLSNFSVANGDANNSATALGIVANTTGTSINSGRLNRQQVSRNTLLSSLNGGKGIDVADIKITDSTGQIGAVDLNPTNNEAKTLGDVIDRINALTNIGVEARINDRGDGIVLVDTAGGTGKLTVAEVGGHTTAKDLRILGSVQGQIDGTATTTVTLDADDTLADVVTKINALDGGVSASLINDGTGQRLSITADQSGAASAVAIDTAGTSLALQEVTSGRDALLVYGSSGSSGVLISSSTNDFNNVIDGVNVTINDATGKPVTVSVQNTNASVVSTANDFVNAFNSLRHTLDKMTVYNADDQTTGILFGTQSALRVDSDLGHILTSRFFGVGKYQSLEAVGISLDDKGHMSLDEAKLSAAFAQNPNDLKKFFADDTLGVAKKISNVVEQLAGKDNSLLSSRTDALTRTIDANTKRIDDMSDRLDRQREQLLAEFDALETTVSNLKSNLTALNSLQLVPPLTSSK